MRRLIVAGLIFGMLNALVGAASLALVEVLTPDEFGWFSYVPLKDALVQDPRFPWQYIVVPLALLVTNVIALPPYVRWMVRRSGPDRSATML